VTAVSSPQDRRPLRWRKHGLAFRAAGQRPWLSTHASLPVAQPLGNGRFRVLFAGRDAANRSHVGAVEITVDGDGNVEAGEPSAHPVLAPGPLGGFDDHGVYPASLVEDGARLLLYYIGWNPGPQPPLFYATIGLAVSDDGGATFVKQTRSPLVGRSEVDPLLVTSPCVRRDDGRWRMWYVSGLRWEEHGDALRSYYHVRYAESDDGRDWRREGAVAIDLQGDERNIARPCVMYEGDRWRMWYSASADAGYRVGYAESADGVSWERLDKLAGIAPSAEGWDSEALAYPWVVPDGERLVMFYNGNGYGRDGFGVATAAR
jgi:predicted GH43/DUF377 family glycosyl hydrolase